MEFLQLSLRLDRAEAAHAEALLNLAGALALTFVDSQDSPLFEPAPGTTPLWERPEIHALFPLDTDGNALTALLRRALPSVAGIDVRGIDDRDWQAGLEQAVFVRRIAGNLGVIPADWDGTLPAQNCVRLHMGLAFGTGRHPTTALCLDWLAANPPRRLDVCDFGCGSGVLAIAALKLGATSAVAIDNDPQAVAASRENARLNGVARALRAGPREDFPTLEADLVLANILAGTLRQSADTIAAMLRPRGRIVLSGVLAEQTRDVAAAFASRFEPLDTRLREGWACMTAVLR